MAIKKTNEQFLQDLYNKHKDLYTPLESYVNNKTKIKFKCNTCNNEFYMQPNMILGEQNCPKCSRLRGAASKRKTHEQFIKELYEVHGNKYEILEPYKGIKTKIKVKCTVCNNIFKMQPAQLLAGANCPKCAKKKAVQKITDTEEQFREKLKNIHGDKYINIEPYINYATKIKIHCNECDNEWSITPANLLNGHGCPQCAIRKQREINIFTNEEFQEKLKQIHRGSYSALNNFTDLKTLIKIHCNICNNEFSILPLDILKPGIQCENCKNNITVQEKTDYIVYYIKDKTTDAPIYVGITNNLQRRFNHHFIDPTDILCTLHNLNYKDLFEIVTIKDNITRSHALDIETKYIQDFLAQGYQLHNITKTITIDKQNAMRKERDYSVKKAEIKCIETGEIFNSIQAAMRKHNVSYARLRDACKYGNSAGIDDNLNPLHWQFVPFEGYIIKSIKTNTVYVIEEYNANTDEWIPFYIGITNKYINDRLITHYAHNKKNPNSNPELYEKLCSRGKEYFKQNIRIRALEENIVDRQEALKRETQLTIEYNKKYKLVNIVNIDMAEKDKLQGQTNAPSSRADRFKSIICTTTGNRFNSLIEASNFIGSTLNTINKVCRKKMRVVKGLQFDYLNEEFRQKNNYKWYIILFKLNGQPYYIAYEMGNEQDITLDNILSWRKYLHLTNIPDLSLEILNICENKNELYDKMQIKLKELQNTQLQNNKNELNTMLNKIQRL